jgi:type I restriction enzyme S subunit
VDFDPVIDNALAAGNPIPAEFEQKAINRQEARARAEAEGRMFGLPTDQAKLFPNSFEDSELGPIPAGWKASTVGCEFNLVMGQSPPGETYNLLNEGIAFFQGKTDFGYRFPKERVYCTAPTRMAEKDDTLVSVRAPVGSINLAKSKCAIGRGIASVRHRSGSASITYYAMAELRVEFAKYEQEGTVFGSINKNGFSNLPFVTSSVEILCQFEKLASPLDANIRIIYEEIEILSQIRDSLLPKLISGEIQVA